MWKGSTHLGVGIATSGNKIVVVARYSPAGNFGRRYRENVLRQKPGGIFCFLAIYQHLLGIAFVVYLLDLLSRAENISSLFNFRMISKIFFEITTGILRSYYKSISP